MVTNGLHNPVVHKENIKSLFEEDRITAKMHFT